MQFDGAVITEQNVTFAIVVVKQFVLSNPNKESIRSSYSAWFKDMPIILMAQTSNGRSIYDGRRDIVNFLAKINPARIPWKHFNVA